MRYSDLEAFVTAGLTAKGYGTDGHPAMPLLNPGPWAMTQLYELTPNAMVFLQLGNGAGLTLEHAFDRPFITVRAIGPQNDFATAETLAYDLDNLLLAVGSNAQVGTARVLYITRSGGGPALIDLDTANRYHFQTTYITETPTG